MTCIRVALHRFVRRHISAAISTIGVLREAGQKSEQAWPWWTPAFERRPRAARSGRSHQALVRPILADSIAFGRLRGMLPVIGSDDHRYHNLREGSTVRIPSDETFAWDRRSPAADSPSDGHALATDQSRRRSAAGAGGLFKSNSRSIPIALPHCARSTAFAPGALRQLRLRRRCARQ